MPATCPKCGASLPDSSATFCPSCGAAIGVPQAAAPGVPPAVAPAPGPYAVAPPRRSGGALKAVLIVVGVLGALVVVGVSVVGYMGYSAWHKAKGSISLGSSAGVTDADLGVAIYPGATPKGAGSMRVQVGNSLMVSGTYTTQDPINSVLDFYRSKVGGGQAIENKSVRGTSFESVTINGTVKDSLVVTIAPDPTNSSVTQIVILHTRSSSSSS